MMPSIFLILISIMLMLSFLMLMQTHISRLIKLLIAQNIVLTFYILSKALLYPGFEIYLSFAITVIIKAIILPLALLKLIDYLHLSQQTEPLTNKSSLQFIGIFLVTFALLMSHHIEAVIGRQAIAGFSLALANILLSLLLIIFRRKSISQVIGLLVMENSIFLLSATLNRGFPWLIELGIGFDVLIGFMIFGLFLLRIRTTYGSLHVKHLEKLKERI